LHLRKTKFLDQECTLKQRRQEISVVKTTRKPIKDRADKIYYLWGMLGLGQSLSRVGTPLGDPAFSATFNFDSSTEGFLSIGNSQLTLDQTDFDSNAVLRCTDNSAVGNAFLIGANLSTNSVTSSSWTSPTSTPVYARIRFYVPSSNSGIVGIQKGGFAGSYVSNSSVSGTDQWLTWTWATNTNTFNVDTIIVFFETTDVEGTGDVVYIDRFDVSLDPLV